MTTDLAKLQRLPREVACWQRAQVELLGGRAAAVLPNYRELVQRYPGVVQLWVEMGMAAAGALEFELANKAFAQATEMAGTDPSTLIVIGQQYHRLRRLDQARECFERAVTADASSVQARLSLAAWFERERRLDAAWECVEVCAARHPQNPQVLCVRALLLHRMGRNSEAETLLHDLIKRDVQDPNVRFSSRHLLGVVLDELGDHAQAMAWLCEAKAELRKTISTERLEQDYDRADRQRRELLASLTREMVQRWSREPLATSCRSQLALLGGHPRSGTTLLEQILGAHPDILAFDEPEAFVQEIWNQLAPFQSPDALRLSTLDSLPANRRAELGRRYLKSLLREVQGEPAAEVLLDKNPSPTASLHLWLRIFPGLKVIIALRDPRDVVISCFFQNLMLTATNANFLSLQRTAKHYTDLMDVWLRMRELGGFSWIETRYEDIVSSLETEGRRVTEFLGLSWHENQANHRQSARQKFLFAPTFNDVAKPIHNRAIGRWKNYALHLEPLQERLAPYCRAFGYEV